jgi:hypothetical protein
MKPARFWWIAAFLYSLLLVALGGALVAARRQALATFATESARQEWDQWRAAAAEQDGFKTPVERRVPSSPEPPTLILMRDHFAVVGGGSLLISSAVYWAFALLVRGAFFGPRFDVPAR